MADNYGAKLADKEAAIAAIYEDEAVARSYLEKRLKFSWQRVLHEKQVDMLNRAIANCRPSGILELAPGPARLAVELRDIRRGVMVENSQEMIAIARDRLGRRGLDRIWTIIDGSAFELDKLLAGQSFDFAYSFRFLRHFRTMEREELYLLIRDRLTQRGMLMFDVVSSVTRDAIEGKNESRAADAIAIYDVSYTAPEFRAEMERNGFEVVSMAPVIRRFGLQSWLGHKLDDVAPRVTRRLVRWLEQIPSTAPLEWIALCRKQ